MPVTVPFTTLPSKASFSPPRLSLSRAAKSSRVGKVVVAIRCVVFQSQSGLPRGCHRGEPSHADLVKCTAAAGSFQCGVLGSPAQSRAHSHAKERLPVREPLLTETVRARRKAGFRERL